MGNPATFCSAGFRREAKRFSRTGACAGAQRFTGLENVVATTIIASL